MVDVREDPESTWGASEEYKAAWFDKYGVKSPAASASKEEWKKFAVEHGGMNEGEADATSRDDLVARFGAGVLQSGPTAPNDTAPGGDGTGPAPSAADPAKSGVSAAATTAGGRVTPGGGTSAGTV